MCSVLDGDQNTHSEYIGLSDSAFMDLFNSAKIKFVIKCN